MHYTVAPLTARFDPTRGPRTLMRHLLSPGLTAVSCLLLVACGGGGPAAGVSPPSSTTACSDLSGLVIDAERIGLPTAGARVQSAEPVAAGADGNVNGDYCQVLAAIRPVDPAAPDINVQVNLPVKWNGKALQLGGGGYNGTLVTGLAPIPYGPAGGRTPLSAGYVTLGSDSGHVGTVADGTFALNHEALVNFGGDQLKKTRDVAMALMQAHYGVLPERFYIVGSSQGGHEVMLAVQRWPGDYDGGIATHPVYNFTMLQVNGNALARALYANGGTGWLSPAKVSTLQRVVLQHCDALDGVADGLISHVAGCRSAFSIDSLRCPAGAEGGDACLSDAQIALVKTIDSRFELGFPLQSGITSFSRWPILEGGDWAGLFGFGTRPVPSSPPEPITDFGLHVLADPLVRYFVMRDANTDSLAFVPSDHVDRLQQVSALVDANSVDLAAFKARGGKLLLMHGTADTAVPHHNTIDYYERLVQQFGPAALDEFVRFYLVPGFGHGTGPFVAAWDSLSVLEAWVERGTAPANLQVADASAAQAGRTRPLCEYPGWPRFTGGDPNQADSFVCER